MNIDEARGRLHKAAMYMNADQAIDPSASSTDLRDQLRLVFSQHADKPIIVMRMLQSLLDDIITDQIAGYDHALVKLLCRNLRETLETVASLTAQGFEEGAWFRASDAIGAAVIYLDGIQWVQNHTSATAPDS